MTDRPKTMKLRALAHEFEALKARLFPLIDYRNGHPFTLMTNTPDEQRYQQLLGLFFPAFRTAGWVNPIMEG